MTSSSFPELSPKGSGGNALSGSAEHLGISDKESEAAEVLLRYVPRYFVSGHRH